MQEKEDEKSIIINISSRIIDIIAHLGLNMSEFAREIGVSKARLSNIINNKNNPDLEFCAKIATKYKVFNLEWLVMGNGSMLKTTPFDKNEVPFDKFSSGQHQMQETQPIYKTKQDLTTDASKIESLEQRIKEKDEQIKDLRYIITMQKESIDLLKEQFSRKDGTPTLNIA